MLNKLGELFFRIIHSVPTTLVLVWIVVGIIALVVFVPLLFCSVLTRAEFIITIAFFDWIFCIVWILSILVDIVVSGIFNPVVAD